MRIFSQLAPLTAAAVVLSCLAGFAGPALAADAPANASAEQRRARFEERLKNMTPEQKAQMEARRAEFERMTPEQRRAKMEERFKDLTPEQKAQMEARRAEFERMTPEQRRAKMEERFKNLTPEQQAQMEARREQARANRQAQPNR